MCALSLLFFYIHANIKTSDVVEQIFEPTITCLRLLVAEQVANVRIKRMAAYHPKGKEIEVILSFKVPLCLSIDDN